MGIFRRRVLLIAVATLMAFVGFGAPAEAASSTDATVAQGPATVVVHDGDGSTYEVTMHTVDAGSTSQAGWQQIPIGEGFTSCPNFTFCVWQHYNAQGIRAGYTGNITCGDYGIWAGGNFENQLSALANNTTVTITLLDRYPNGDWYELADAGPTWGGNLYHTINDKADGFAWRRC